MKHLKNTHTTRRGLASRGAKDPRYWLEMAFSGWQQSDRILGVYGIVPCCLGTPMLYRRKTYHWSMGGSFEESGCWQVCHAWNGMALTFAWQSPVDHICICAPARIKSTCEKNMNISNYPILRKPPRSEGPLLHKILQYIMAHLPKEILPKATPCLYLDFFNRLMLYQAGPQTAKNRSIHAYIIYLYT